MTLSRQIRRRVRSAIDAARSRAADGSSRVRVADSANVVVARNIGTSGDSAASAHQTVVVRDGTTHTRTERTVVSDSSSRRQEKESRPDDRHADT